LGVICLDTPSGEVEVCSSYDLSIFSLKTDAQLSEGGGSTHEGSSSVSIGELWVEMDMMDAISHRGTSTRNIPRSAHHERRSVPLVLTTGECTSHIDKGALLEDTPRPSNTLSRGHGKYSTKNKATQILSAAPGAISPRMRRSFVDR
jgi:hypothetical protein